MSGRKPRFLHPNIWMDDKVLALSPLAKLLFVALITYSDDDGRVQIQQSLGLPLGLSPIWPQLGEILGQKLYVGYLFEGKKYAFAPNWSRYQRPKYKTSSRLPDPQSVGCTLIDCNNYEHFCPNPHPIVRAGSGSGSGSGSGTNKEQTLSRKRNGYSEDFEEIWAVHPYGSKSAAAKQYEKQKASAPAKEELIATLQKQLAWVSSAPQGEFRAQLPHLERWFRHHRWEDTMTTRRPTKVRPGHVSLEFDDGDIPFS